MYDPLEEALNAMRLIYQDTLDYHASAETCIKATNLCIVINPDKEYTEMNEWSTDDHVIFDCWRTLSLTKGTHICFGVG